MRRVIALSAAALVLAAAGCDSGGGNGATRTPTPPPGSSVTAGPTSGTATTTAPPVTSPPDTPHPTRSGPLTTGAGVKPGEKPPVFPAAARQHNSAGALAMAAYYIQALDWSIATTDPYLVKEISAPGCPACNRVVSTLTAMRARGERLRGGRIKLLGARLLDGEFSVKSDFAVEVTVDEAAETAISPTAPPSSVASQQSGALIVFVSWAKAQWQVVDVRNKS